MTTFEEDFKKFLPVISRLSNFALLGKKVVIKGRENFIKQGPNIIVGNHVGSFKDIATLFKIVPRPIFFTANKMIFDKEEFNFLIKKHLQRHLKNFGLLANVIIHPLKSYLVNYISTNIGKVGTIPVDLTQKKMLALERCQDHLRKGRAIIALQGRGRIMKNDKNPYVSSFKRGVSIISYNLYQAEGIRVPVTPIAIFGTQVPFFIPAKIRVNVGESMYITDYIGEEITGVVNRFKDALERRVESLFSEFLRK